MCLSLLIVVIDSTILNTALPTLARVLPASTTGLQWITDAYSLVFAALLIVAGALGDRFGRRRALLAGLGIFGAGLDSRCPVRRHADADRRPRRHGSRRRLRHAGHPVDHHRRVPCPGTSGAIGAWSAVAGLGVVAGPSLGGLLLDHFYWGSVFWLNIPLIAAAMVTAVLVVPGLAGQRLAGPAGHPRGRCCPPPRWSPSSTR